MHLNLLIILKWMKHVPSKLKKRKKGRLNCKNPHFQSIEFFQLVLWVINTKCKYPPGRQKGWMNQSVGVYSVLFAKLSTYPKKEKRKKSWPLTPTHKTKVQRYAPDSKVKTRPQCLASKHKHKHIYYNQLQTHRHCSSFKTHSPLLLLWLPSISPTIKPSFQLL